MSNARKKVSWSMFGKASMTPPKQIKQVPKAEQLELDMTRTARNSIAVETAAAVWRKNYCERNP